MRSVLSGTLNRGASSAPAGPLDARKSWVKSEPRLPPCVILEVLSAHRPSIPCLLVLSGALACTPSETPRAEPAEWTLVYYLPYDNDLDPAAEPILRALSRVPRDRRIRVAAFVDRQGSDGIERHLHGGADAFFERLAADASSDVESLAGALRWVEEHAPARSYAVFLAGHSGGLADYAYDTNPGASDAQRWMDVRDVERVLADWRPRRGRVRLLYLQQCARSTVETVHLMRHVAPVVIASQASMGAPNAYYDGMLRELVRNPGLSPEQLARVIVENEDPDMFAALTAVRTEPLDRLGARLSDAIDPLLGVAELISTETRLTGRTEPGQAARLELPIETLGEYELTTRVIGDPIDLAIELENASGETVAADSNSGVGLEPRVAPVLDRGDYVAVIHGEETSDDGPFELIVRRLDRPAETFRWEDERFVDVIDWLAELYARNGLSPEPVQALERFVRDDVVLVHRVSPERVEQAGRWSGLSIAIASEGTVLERYAGFSLYNETNLGPLQRRLLASPARSMP